MKYKLTTNKKQGKNYKVNEKNTNKNEAKKGNEEEIYQ